MAAPVERLDRAFASAGICTRKSTSKVEAYIAAGIAPATRRAYQPDLDHFRAWGGSVPATDAQVASYLADHAGVLSAATLTTRLAAILVAQRMRLTSCRNRSSLRLWGKQIRGIRRKHGVAQRQTRRLLRDDLFDIPAKMGDRPKDLRDRALLLIGFAGRFRRADLCAIVPTTAAPIPAR